MNIERALEIAAEIGVDERAMRAARMFHDRKNRKTNPPGEFDSRKRFYADERTESVRSCRAPSVRFPYPELKAARTAAHCAEVCRAETVHLIAVRSIVRVSEKWGITEEYAKGQISAAWKKAVRAEQAAIDAAIRIREAEEQKVQDDVWGIVRRCYSAESHAIAAV